jgi:predicted GNAT family N-acyltransferase
LATKYTFKVANSGEAIQALALQGTVYEEDVGHVPSDTFDHSATYFVALDARRTVVATFRIVGPEQRPFDVEEHVDLNKFIPQNRALGLIGRLCVRRDHRGIGRSGFLPLEMFKLAYLYSKSVGITDLVMYTFPDLVAFYKRVFFRELCATFNHAGYQRRMHVMHLDLLALDDYQARSADPLFRWLIKVPHLGILL